MKEMWHLLKEHWTRVLSFVALWLILGLGIYQLLFLIPVSALIGIEQLLSSEPTLDENMVRFNISLWVSCGLNALFFYFYFKRIKYLLLSKEVKVAIEVLDEFDCASDSSVFELVRKAVESTIIEYPEKFTGVIKEQGITPRQKVYSMMEHVAGDYLESGSLDFFVSRGLLNPFGEKLLRVYDLIIDRMRDISFISDEEAIKQKSDIRNCIKQVG